ncbi:MAG: cyclic-di-AMP receptor [Clostridia bacterium]
MKLLFAIVQNEDVKRLTRSLSADGYSITKISTTGGFLQGGNSTLMMGVEDDGLEHALELIKKASSIRKQYVSAPQASMPGLAPEVMGAPIQVTVGGAVVFITEVYRFLRF